MTIRLGKSLYYCQDCWKSKNAKNSKAATATSAGTAKRLPPPAVTSKPPINNRAPRNDSVAAAPSGSSSTFAAPGPLRQEQSRGVPQKVATEKTAPSKVGTAETSSADSNNNREEEMEKMKPSVPAAVTTKSLRGDRDLAEDTAKKLNVKAEDSCDGSKKSEEEVDCFICAKPAGSGTFYTCGQWQYHEKCITCHSCGRADRDKWGDCLIYPNEDEGGKGVKFVCKECNVANAPKCASCDKPITDGVLTVGAADGKDIQYHPDCLNCGLCGKNMARGEDLIYVNGQLNCAECRKKNALTCRRCNETIMGPYNSVAGDSEGTKFIYHAKCFLCIFCDADLNSVDLGGKTEVEEGKREVYCKECHLEKFCEKCARCSKPLIGEFFRMGSEKICKECCRCAACNNYIGGKFRMDTDGKFQCIAQECPGNRTDK